jgi:hypothetical protein
MQATGRSVNIGQREFACPCHACAFFNSRDEEYEMLLPFAKDGYEAGERLYQLVDKDHRDERLRRLSSSGINLDKAAKSGQLEVRSWEEAYLRGDRFDQYEMMDLVQAVLRDSMSTGFPMTRVWANMEWALKELPGVSDLVEYESRVNRFLPQYQAFVVCTYDLTKFSAPLVVDIMRTHPQVIIGGTLHENPFYVPPDELLDELSRRAD